MNPTPWSNPTQKRIGFHYFPDTWHYRQSDLEIWLPRLVELGASWLTLHAPAERAIPEGFIQVLLSAGVRPILHFPLNPAEPIPLDSLRLLFRAYARWGVQHVAFFDRPNTRESWPVHIWAQNFLVERFLDDFIPLAQAAHEQGLMVITPPLEPAGDYWDLAFLRTSLRGLKRRGHTDVLDFLAIGAYAWINDRPLDWGAGGPERWPEARPYRRPESRSSDTVQDHLGFHIFDWYLAICQEELGTRLPVFLLRAGQKLDQGQSVEQRQAARFDHARKNLSALQQITGDPASEPDPKVVPDEVVACNFWLLSADPAHPQASDGWFLPNGEHLPVVEAFRQWAAHLRRGKDTSAPADVSAEISSEVTGPDDAQVQGLDIETPTDDLEMDGGRAVSELSEPADPDAHIPVSKNQPAHPINHYILLPLYAWGGANWELSMVEGLLQESHPAIGFSLAEARLAKRVTVVGADGAVSIEALAMLRKSGCQVERLLEDGTLIAS